MDDAVTIPRHCRDLRSALGQKDRAIREAFDQAFALQPLNYLRGCPLADAEMLGQIGQPRFPDHGDQITDQLDIILSDLSPLSLPHAPERGRATRRIR
jgi:hypothetical protein